MLPLLLVSGVCVDLGRMYQLASHVADGLGKLKSLLEKHICTQGLSAIEKCGDSALNVSPSLRSSRKRLEIK